MTLPTIAVVVSCAVVGCLGSHSANEQRRCRTDGGMEYPIFTARPVCGPGTNGYIIASDDSCALHICKKRTTEGFAWMDLRRTGSKE